MNRLRRTAVYQTFHYHSFAQPTALPTAESPQVPSVIQSNHGKESELHHAALWSAPFHSRQVCTSAWAHACSLQQLMGRCMLLLRPAGLMHAASIALRDTRTCHLSLLHCLLLLQLTNHPLCSCTQLSHPTTVSQPASSSTCRRTRCLAASAVFSWPQQQ